MSTAHVQGYTRRVGGRTVRVRPHQRRVKPGDVRPKPAPKQSAAQVVAGVRARVAKQRAAKAAPARAAQAEDRYGAPFNIKWGDYEARVVDVIDRGDNLRRRVTVAGEVLHKGKKVGYFNRDFAPKRDGTMNVHHTEFNMDEAHQGSGFGRVFIDESMDAYPGMNVSDATVDAAYVGGYAWASMGFEFEGREIGEMLDALRSEVEYDERSAHTYPPDELEAALEFAFQRREAMDALDRAYANDEIRSMQDIASLGADEPFMLGWEHGTDDWRIADRPRKMWAGKLLLLGSNWQGVKRFQVRESDNQATFDRLYRAWRLGRIPGYPENELPLMQAYLKARSGTTREDLVREAITSVERHRRRYKTGKAVAVRRHMRRVSALELAQQLARQRLSDLPSISATERPGPRDTPQMKSALRQNPTARKVRARFPPGTRVQGAPGVLGTVERHIPMTNAQGGVLVVRWDNGEKGRHSPIALTLVPPSGPSANVPPGGGGPSKRQQRIAKKKAQPVHKPPAPPAEPTFIPVVGETVYHPGRKRSAKIIEVRHPARGTEIEVEWEDSPQMTALKAELRKARKELRRAEASHREITRSTSTSSRAERNAARTAVARAQTALENVEKALKTKVGVPDDYTPGGTGANRRPPITAMGERDRLSAAEFRQPRKRAAGPAKAPHPDSKPLVRPKPKPSARLSHPDNPDPAEYTDLVRGGKELDPKTAPREDLRGALAKYRVGTSGRWEWGIIIDRKFGQIRVAELSTGAKWTDRDALPSRSGGVKWIQPEMVEKVKTVPKAQTQKELWTGALRKTQDAQKEEVRRAREGLVPKSPRPTPIARVKDSRTRHEEVLDALGLGHGVTWTSEDAVLSGPEGHQEMTNQRTGIVIGHPYPDMLQVWDADQKENVLVHYSRVGKNFKRTWSSQDLENELYSALQAAERKSEGAKQAEELSRKLGREVEVQAKSTPEDRKMRTAIGGVFKRLRDDNEASRKPPAKDEELPRPDWAQDEWPPRRDHEDAVPSNLHVGDSVGFVHGGQATTEGVVLKNDPANRQLIVFSPTAQRRLQSAREDLDRQLASERRRLQAQLEAKPGEVSSWEQDRRVKERARLQAAVKMAESGLKDLKREHNERSQEFRKVKRTRGEIAALRARFENEIAAQERQVTKHRDELDARNALWENTDEQNRIDKPNTDEKSRTAFAEFEKHYERESKRLDKAIAKREKRITVPYDDVHHVSHETFDDRRRRIENLAGAPRALITKAVLDVEADRGERQLLVDENGESTWARNPDFRWGDHGLHRYPDSPTLHYEAYDDDGNEIDVAVPYDRAYYEGAETREERAAQRVHEDGGMTVARRRTLANGDYVDASAAEIAHWVSLLWDKQIPVVSGGTDNKGNEIEVPMRDPAGTPAKQVKNKADFKKTVLGWIDELPENTLLKVDDNDLIWIADAAEKLKGYEYIGERVDEVRESRKKRLGSANKLAEHYRQSAMAMGRAALYEAAPLAPGGQWKRVVERHNMPDGTVRYVPRLVLLRRFRPRFPDRDGNGLNRDFTENVGGYTRKSLTGKTVAVKGYGRKGPKPKVAAVKAPSARTLKQLPLPLTRQEQERQKKALTDMMVKMRGNKVAEREVKARLKRLDQVAKLAKLLGTTIREAEALLDQWCLPFEERWSPEARAAALRARRMAAGKALGGNVSDQDAAIALALAALPVSSRTAAARAQVKRTESPAERSKRLAKNLWGDRPKAKVPARKPTKTEWAAAKRNVPVLPSTLLRQEKLRARQAKLSEAAGRAWRERGSLLRNRSGVARVGGYTRREDGKTIRVRAHRRRFDPAEMLAQATAHRQVGNVGGLRASTGTTGKVAWPRPPEGPFDSFQGGAQEVYEWTRNNRSRLFGALAGSRTTMRDYIVRELMTDDELYEVLEFEPYVMDRMAAVKVRATVQTELRRRGRPPVRQTVTGGSGKYANGVFTAPNPGRPAVTRAEKAVKKMTEDDRIDLADSILHDYDDNTARRYWDAISNLSDEDLLIYSDQTLHDLSYKGEQNGWDENFIGRLDDLVRFGIGERTDPRLGRAGSILGGFLSLDGTDPDQPVMAERVNELNLLSPDQLRTLRDQRVGVTLTLRSLGDLKEQHFVLDMEDRRTGLPSNAVGLYIPRQNQDYYGSLYPENVDTSIDSEVLAFTHMNYNTGDEAGVAQDMGPVLLHEVGHALHDLGYFGEGDSGEPHWKRISAKTRERIYKQGETWGFTKITNPEGASVYEPVLRSYFADHGPRHGGREIIAEGFGWLTKLGRGKTTEFFYDQDFAQWLEQHVYAGWTDAEIAEALLAMMEGRADRERSAPTKGGKLGPPGQQPPRRYTGNEPWSIQTEGGLFIDGVGPYEIKPSKKPYHRLTRPVSMPRPENDE